MIRSDKNARLTAVGQRPNNEDYLGMADSVFVVCDGVGGSQKGEIASALIVNTILEGYKKNAKADLLKLVEEAEQRFTSYIRKNPDAGGMASTLTFTQLQTDGVFVGWCGDSRVYQFRNGKIIFKTNDHSWVNQAMAAGIITPEEAQVHPHAKVITRAIQGSEKPEKVDTVLLKDVQKGDIFLHCTDGVLEALTDEDLQDIFTASDDPGKIIKRIDEVCKTHSKDNYTAIIYRIGEASGAPKKTKMILLVFLLVLIVAAAGTWVRKINNDKAKSSTEKQKPPIEKQKPVP